AFMAVGVKAAAFAAFARVFVAGLGRVAASWTGLLWVLAALTMTVGNITAVRQRSVKRMLAYSSIAHAGYALVGLVAGGKDGGAALLFYLAVYSFMTLGAFAVLIALGRRGEPNEDLADWAGVGFRHPVLGLSMAVFMLSLAGVPPTAGFAGKFYLFSAAVDAGQVGLAVIGVLNSLVSVYYYLGVLVAMYMTEGERAIVAPAARARAPARTTAPFSASCSRRRPRSRSCSIEVWKSGRPLRLSSSTRSVRRRRTGTPHATATASTSSIAATTRSRVAGSASTSATVRRVSVVTALKPAFQASFSQAATRMSRRSS